MNSPSVTGARRAARNVIAVIHVRQHLAITPAEATLTTDGAAIVAVVAVALSALGRFLLNLIGHRNGRNRRTAVDVFLSVSQKTRIHRHPNMIDELYDRFEYCIYDL